MTIKTVVVRMPGSRAAQVVTCGILLLGFVALKLQYNPPLGDGLDGAYYFHIARHVANGEGLVTTLSIYHMGLAPLPQPATTYPLLPLLLGSLGKVVDLGRAAELFPEALYLASLALVWLFIYVGVRRSDSKRAPSEAFAMGMAAAVWLGLNPIYHWASSRPYTESLGLVLVLSTLLAYGAARAKLWKSSWTRAAGYAGVGFLAGACYLARFQLLVVLVALVLSRVLTSDRKRIRDLCCLALGALPPIAWFVARVFSLPNAEPLVLFDFAKYRQLASLPVFTYVAPCGTFLGCAGEKLDGLLEAFDLRSSDSYVAQFGVVAWLLPLAGALLVYRIFERRSPFKLPAGPRHAIWVASAAVGLLAVIPIHLVHSLHWRVWTFGWRQGLPFAFLLLPVAAWLFLSAGSVGRWLVTLGFALSISANAQRSLALPERDARPGWLEVRAVAAAYLERVAKNSRTLGIEPQPLSAFTGAPLDWLACWSSPKLAEMLVVERGAQRIVLAPGEFGCPSVATLRPRLKLERLFRGREELGVFRILPR